MASFSGSPEGFTRNRLHHSGSRLMTSHARSINEKPMGLWPDVPSGRPKASAPGICNPPEVPVIVLSSEKSSQIPTGTATATTLALALCRDSASITKLNGIAVMHIKETGNSVKQKVDVLPFRRQRKETTADTIGNNRHSQCHTEMDDFISYTQKKQASKDTCFFSFIQ